MCESSRTLPFVAILFVCCASCGGGSGGGGTNPILISTPTPPTTPTPPPGVTNRKPKFAYTANELSGDISGFSVDASSGALAPLPGFPVSIAGGPQFITADVQGKFAFVANGASVWVLAIDPNSGALQQITGSPFSGGPELDWIALHPSGRFLYAAARSGNVVYGFNLAPDTGVLTPIAGSPFPTGGTQGFGTCVAIHPAGKFLYETDQTNVYSFTIDGTTGALSMASSLPATSPNGILAVDPSGTFIYVVGPGSNSELTYSVEANTGVLTLASTSPLAARDGAYTITLDSVGRYAYTVEASQRLQAYAITNGKLSPVGSLLTGALGTLQLVIDPSGNFLYAPQTGADNNIGAWRIDGTGTLSSLPGSPFPTGQWPLSIVVTSQ